MKTGKWIVTGWHFGYILLIYDIPRFLEPKLRNPGSSHRLGGLTLIDWRADGTLKQATGTVVTGFDIPEFPSPDITHRPPGWLSKLAG